MHTILTILTCISKYKEILQNITILTNISKYQQVVAKTSNISKYYPILLNTM